MGCTGVKAEPLLVISDNGAVIGGLSLCTAGLCGGDSEAGCGTAMLNGLDG